MGRVKVIKIDIIALRESHRLFVGIGKSNKVTLSCNKLSPFASTPSWISFLNKIVSEIEAKTALKSTRIK